MKKLVLILSMLSVLTVFPANATLYNPRDPLSSRNVNHHSSSSSTNTGKVVLISAGIVLGIVVLVNLTTDNHYSFDNKIRF